MSRCLSVCVCVCVCDFLQKRTLGAGHSSLERSRELKRELKRAVPLYHSLFPKINLSKGRFWIMRGYGDVAFSLRGFLSEPDVCIQK